MILTVWRFYLLYTQGMLAYNLSRSCSHVAVLSDGGALRTMVPGQDSELAQQRTAGERFDEEQFQVDTHAVSNSILAAIAVRHGDQCVFFFVFAILCQVAQRGGKSK